MRHASPRLVKSYTSIVAVAAPTTLWASAERRPVYKDCGWAAATTAARSTKGFPANVTESLLQGWCECRTFVVCVARRTHAHNLHHAAPGRPGERLDQ